MEIVKGVTRHGESFAVDHKKFTDCTFVDCVLEYGGGPVVLERTSLRGCRYLFSGTAKMTLEFLDCVGLLPMESSEWNHEKCLVH